VPTLDANDHHSQRYGIFWVPNDVSFALNPINDMINASATTYTGTVDGTHPYIRSRCPSRMESLRPPGRSLGTRAPSISYPGRQEITEVDRAHHPSTTFNNGI